MANRLVPVLVALCAVFCLVMVSGCGSGDTVNPKDPSYKANIGKPGMSAGGAPDASKGAPTAGPKD